MHDEENAIDWLVTLGKPDVPPLVRARLERWKEVPANRQAFDEDKRLWDALGTLPRPAWPSDAAAAADTYDGLTAVSVFDGEEFATQPKRRTSPSWGGLAATVAVLIFGLTLGSRDSVESRPTGMTSFATARGEHEKVVLPDFSQIQLGGETTVTIDFRGDMRFVDMRFGEALYTVAHDSSRPFRVYAGGAVITAVGTAFNVRRLDGVTVVAVTEGTVDVAPASAVSARNGGDRPLARRVRRGEMISYRTDGTLDEVCKADLRSTTAWISGRLTYTSEPLARVVQDINRYSKKSVTVTEAAGAIQYSGTVFERDVRDWLEALPRLFSQVQLISPNDQQVIIDASGAVEKR